MEVYEVDDDADDDPDGEDEGDGALLRGVLPAAVVFELVQSEGDFEFGPSLCNFYVKYFLQRLTILSKSESNTGLG